ncbi:MAG TPA: carbonic anhydrase [Myxococcales bacterium]|nr:carbonic anhydrase [Myxococcales bacterium]
MYRRDLLRGIALAAVPALSRSSATEAASPSSDGPSADEALRQLLEGNQRFMKGETTGPRRKPEDFRPLAAGQRPEAIIVGCADSRVPPELIFDQGVGDLFIVRVAGNVVGGGGALVKGSIEYGVAELGVPLVMVLGHSECGVIKAAIKHMDDRDALPGAIAELVNRLRPAVAKTKGMPGDRLDNTIRANVTLGVETLRTLRPVLAPAVAGGRVRVVGAVYDLRTGGVVLTT